VTEGSGGARVSAEVTPTDWITAIATGFIALFTIALFVVAWLQRADTKIIQRAYLSVKPKGIVTDTSGNLLGHVAFKNVGKLPATEFITVVKDVVVHHGNWATPTLTDGAFGDNDEEPGLVPIGAEVPRGSPGISLAQVDRSEVSDTERYLYVWGRAKFRDGFSSGRWINFCHRYPWVKRKVQNGSVTISKRWARYHHRGNKADE
jgi:hypothetical protein